MAAMTNWDWAFLLLRLITSACCLAAMPMLWRYARVRGLEGAQLLPILGTMGFLLVLASLTLAEGHREATLRAGMPTPLLDWFWLGTDLVIPIGVVLLLRALRQRDALEGQLYAAARHDPLTGLPNRTGFTEAAARALGMAAREGRPVAAAMLDLDRFKRINDGWGHAAGDAVLLGTAAALRAALRPGDVLARMGGEEFALVLPGVTAEEALPLLDRLREAVRTAVPHPGGAGEQVTLSAGVATMPRQELGALDATLQAADRALYAAKEAGRNRALPAPATAVLPAA
jgi:diguanylate cyclase (GGDEF)-like protein